MSTTNTHFELVGEFHTVFDYPVRTERYEEVFDQDPKLLQSRLAFIREERDEFLEALENSDLVEMADALCDLNYFAFGSGQCLGINLDDELRKAGYADIATTSTTDGFMADVDPKVVETDRAKITARLDEITEHIDQFAQAITDRVFEGLATHLTTTIISTFKLGYYLNFDMDRMFREVHRSNMTKVCLNIEDANESLRRYEEEGRYKKPVIRTKGQYFMVYDEDLNKILKNYKWENPNLRQFMGPKYE
jgi:predicted HAD superfamily Cof-like phosphohydrolase